MDNIELLFNPASEFQVLEEFEFDELIERPTAIRFFTLQEQKTDFVEKMLPKTGRVSKGIIRQIEHEVDTFELLYTSLLQETTDGYSQKKYQIPESLPWVHYINTTEPQKTVYSWDNLKLTQTELGPNFYFRMLDTLPKSAFYFLEGSENLVYTHHKVKINNYIYLDDYSYTQTSFHPDGSYKIEKVQRTDTRDLAKFTGYRVDKPPLDFPNPLSDHAFLSTHAEPININTTEKLSEILPSMETIFEHAVPQTSNPYTEGRRYLQIFNIALQDVPYSIWKTKFPPVPVIEAAFVPTSINFPETSEEPPSKQLLDVYKNPWYSSLSSRHWLSKQEDGGALVSKFLQSMAGDVGVVAIPPPITFPEARIIVGTPEECLPTEITGFDDFFTRGIYRAPKCPMCKAVGHTGNTCPIEKAKRESDREYAPGYGCVPLSLVAVEREAALYQEKQAWTPETREKILKEHVSEIERHRNYHTEYFIKPPSTTPASLLSEKRQLIIKILSDDKKLPEDQLHEIQELLKDAVLENHLYKDSDGAFLICEHQIDILRGEFNKDPDAYLKKWSAKVDGFYICQYSGDRIAEVIQNQDQYDEQGHIINKHDRIGVPGYLPKEHLSFAVNLRNLQAIFNIGEPSEDILYLLISLVQVLPEEKQLIPLLSFIREETAKVKTKLGSKIKEKKNEVELIFGIFGFNAFVILLQSHIPQLVPRRSFGGRPLVLHGYPREGTETPLIDSLLGALQQTFESYPTTFKSSSVVFLRTLLKDKKAVKKSIMSGLQKQFVPKFKSLLQHASDNLEAVSVGYTVTQAYQPSIFRPTKDVSYLPPSEVINAEPETRYTCYSGLSCAEPSTAFSFRQPELSITDSLVPSTKATYVRNQETVLGAYVPGAEEVRRRLKFPSPSAAIFKKILSNEKPRTLQIILLQIFALASLENPSEDVRRYVVEQRKNVEAAYENPSLLRDYFRGVLLEFLTFLTPALERAIVQDTAIRSLLSTAGETRTVIDKLSTAEREEFKTRLRRMTDAQREVTKQLIDLGLAPYLITKQDREGFLREVQEQELITDNPLVAPGDKAAPENIPEEGLHNERDIGPQGEVPQNNDIELPYDFGDYGDARARTSEGEEYADASAYDYEEDF